MTRRLMAWVVGMSALIAMVLSPADAARPYPYKQHMEQEIDSHQFVYIDIDITATGKVTVFAKFSNGKRFAGNRFFARTTFYDANKVPLFSIEQEKGLNASLGLRGAVEGTVVNSYQMTEEQMQRFHTAGLYSMVRDGCKSWGGFIGPGSWKGGSEECQPEAAPRFPPVGTNPVPKEAY